MVGSARNSSHLVAVVPDIIIIDSVAVTLAVEIQLSGVVPAISIVIG